MAKQKGGLGRGLSSLLGEDIDSGVSRETPKAVEHDAAAPEEEKETASGQNNNKRATATANGATANGARTKGADEPLEAPGLSDEVPIDSVVPNPNQPRSNFNREELEELAESIKRNGLLQPPLVRKVGDTYEIIAGERRWQACKLLNMETIPVRIRTVAEDDMMALALVENIQRSDLNPIEEAYGYRYMMEHGNMTQSQVAEAVSKGRSTIANALRLLELPDEAQQLLFEDRITAGHARAILSIPTDEGRQKLTEKLINEKLSVREAEAIARLLSGKKGDKPAARPQVPKSFKTVARSLREALGADVRVKSTKDKNKIEITFEDEADLERIFRIITSE